MNDKSTLLIEKLITLTKEHKLNWEVYEQSNIELNFEKTSFFDSSFPGFKLSTSVPILHRSYITRFNKGYIALFAYTYLSLNNHVELVLQADDDSFPNTVASSCNGDVEISSKIKRLYNLIDLDTDRANVSSYIDEILSD